MARHHWVGEGSHRLAAVSARMDQCGVFLHAEVATEPNHFSYRQSALWLFQFHASRRLRLTRIAPAEPKVWNTPDSMTVFIKTKLNALMFIQIVIHHFLWIQSIFTAVTGVEAGASILWMPAVANGFPNQNYCSDLTRIPKLSFSSSNENSLETGIHRTHPLTPPTLLTSADYSTFAWTLIRFTRGLKDSFFHSH